MAFSPQIPLKPSPQKTLKETNKMLILPPRFHFVVEGLSSHLFAGGRLKMVGRTLGYLFLGPPPGLHMALGALYGLGNLKAYSPL